MDQITNEEIIISIKTVKFDLNIYQSSLLPESFLNNFNELKSKSKTRL